MADTPGRTNGYAMSIVRMLRRSFCSARARAIGNARFAEQIAGLQDVDIKGPADGTNIRVASVMTIGNRILFSPPSISILTPTTSYFHYTIDFSIEQTRESWRH